MGGGRFEPSHWDKFKTVHSVATKSVAETFSRAAKADFNPATVERRESCETADKPQVTPIIIALDVTGSMGKIPHELIKGGLGTLMEQILARKSIPNPHVMFMAVGDVNYDSSPLQVTQFEADIRIAEQLKELFIEGGGGGNESESYPIAWYFAATKTDLDCLKNRGEKGLLFTIGDEFYPAGINGAHLKKFLGLTEAADVSTAAILEQTQKMFDVFHLCINQGSNYKPEVQQQWNELLGERAIPVADYNKVSEIIVSTIDVMRGHKPATEVVASWGGDRETQLAVAQAIGGLSAMTIDSSPSGIYRPDSGKKAKLKPGAL
jgi:hypothetical protein